MNHIIELNKKFWETQSNYFINTAYKGGRIVPTLSKLERFYAQNIKGKTLHPFCNFGMNTFCLEQYSNDVTGLDFSATSISFANSYKKNIKSNVKFILSNFFEFTTTDKFDSIFISYGVLDWVIDLDLFFKKVNELLKPSGQIIILEYHYNFYKELIKEYNGKKLENNLYEIEWNLNEYKNNPTKSIYGSGRIIVKKNISAKITLHETDIFLQKSKEYGFKIDSLNYYNYSEFQQSSLDKKIDNKKYYKGDYHDNKPMTFGAILKK